MKETLTEQLWSSPWFEDVVYIEGRHNIIMAPERYLGAWRSVNELRVQLGEQQFDAFLDFVEQRIAGQGSIEATTLLARGRRAGKTELLCHRRFSTKART